MHCQGSVKKVSTPPKHRYAMQEKGTVLGATRRSVPCPTQAHCMHLPAHLSKECLGNTSFASGTFGWQACYTKFSGECGGVSEFFKFSHAQKARGLLPPSLVISPAQLLVVGRGAQPRRDRGVLSQSRWAMWDCGELSSCPRQMRQTGYRHGLMVRA